jgi:transglutaminase-like putative cysteine protease
MAVYNFHYSTIIRFTEKVRSHYFLLRCLPPSTAYQRIVRQQCVFSPSISVSRGMDAFGNQIQYGIIDEPHDIFSFESIGTADLGAYRLVEKLNPIYCYDSPLTQLLPELELFARNLSLPVCTSAKVAEMARRIREVMVYETGATTVKTSAQQAFLLGKGVCQDFSHLLIAVCRFYGIAARYVAGFIAGEGETHSWVEYYDDNCWYGFDPTYDRPVEMGYIKLAHGRDYGDCPVERGVFSGVAGQSLSVNLKVEQQQ